MNWNPFEWITGLWPSSRLMVQMTRLQKNREGVLMNFKHLCIVALSAAALSIPVSEPKAASEDECAIWICLPGGFPSGCGNAHSAMKRRIKNHMSPLPNFGSCAQNPPKGSGSHMSYQNGSVAYIPPRQVCTKWVNRHRNPRCVSWRQEPEKYIKNTVCRRNHKQQTTTPAGCTRTMRYIDVLMEGKILGDTYFF